MNIFNKLKWKFYDIRLFIKSKYQLLRYGFEFRDCWSLDYSLSKWILPRLKHFRKNLIGHPEELGSIEDWQKKIDEMIWGFEFISKQDDYINECFPFDYDFNFDTDKDGYLICKDKRKPDYTKYDEKYKRYQNSMILFAKYLDHLWN